MEVLEADEDGGAYLCLILNFFGTFLCEYLVCEHLSRGRSVKISIVIPALNEAARIGEVFAVLGALPGAHEVIVADGGSEDGTAARVPPPARVVVSPPGRARQMNAGAAAAGGEVILFLHCDTRLPEGALGLIREALADSGVVGGGFCHRFDRDDAFNRFISMSANIRSRVWRLFFGDQAIFIRREVFERLGGYPDIPIFEDWELSRKMRAAGRLAFIETPIVTSARRIDAWGKWRSFYLWWGLSILYALGVPAERLARRYENIR